MLGKTNNKAAVQLPILVFIGVLIGALSPANAQDNARFIIDVVVVTVREEPNDTSKVLARVSSGDRVMATGAVSGLFEQVSLEDEVVGWLDSRYISAKPIARVELAELRTQHQELEALYEQAQVERAEAEESLIKLSDDYRIINEELAGLRREAGQPSESEEQIAQLREQLAFSEEQSEKLLRMSKEIKESADTRWFLIGAGVLFAGIILGLLIPKGRRRSSSWDRF